MVAEHIIPKEKKMLLGSKMTGVNGDTCLEIFRAVYPKASVRIGKSHLELKVRKADYPEIPGDIQLTSAVQTNTEQLQTMAWRLTLPVLALQGFVFVFVPFALASLVALVPLLAVIAHGIKLLRGQQIHGLTALNNTLSRAIGRNETKVALLARLVEAEFQVGRCPSRSDKRDFWVAVSDPKVNSLESMVQGSLVDTARQIATMAERETHSLEGNQLVNDKFKQLKEGELPPFHPMWTRRAEFWGNGYYPLSVLSFFWGLVCIAGTLQSFG